MANEETRSQDQDDEAEREFFASMKPLKREDCQQILAWYDEFRVDTESVRAGGRLRFDLASRLVILEIKVGENSRTVTCSLAKFVKKLTGVAIEELWADAGLQV